MRRKLILGGCAAAALPWLGIARAQPERRLGTASASVLKIDAGKHTASGFIWPDSQHVVTALHVVDSATHIVGHLVNPAGRIEASFPLEVERLLKPADLVLLKLPQPLSRPALELNTSMPGVNESLDALGFPLNIPGISATEVKRRFGGDRLRLILPPKVLATLTDYPSESLEILNLEGNLVPGLSGAPLLDSGGHVVGVANGGLEEGAIGICWGVPSTYLAQLARSTDTQLPRTPAIRQLFAADLQASVKTLQPMSGVTLTRLRSRTFEQLAASADDGLGLSQLATLFGAFQPWNFSFDIYQELGRGATLAVPEGSNLHEQGDTIVVQVAGWPRMSMQVQVRPLSHPDEAQWQSVRFEQMITQQNVPGVMVQADPQWSYLGAVRKSSLLVNRRGIYRSRIKDGIMQPDAYLFETMATDGKTFLGVAAINSDNSPATIFQEVQCAQWLNNPRCSSLFTERRSWAQMVIAAQFSTFPV